MYSTVVSPTGNVPPVVWLCLKRVTDPGVVDVGVVGSVQVATRVVGLKLRFAGEHVGMVKTAGNKNKNKKQKKKQKRERERKEKRGYTIILIYDLLISCKIGVFCFTYGIHIFLFIDWLNVCHMIKHKLAVILKKLSQSHN